MKQSKLPFKTQKDTATTLQSKNAQLLIGGGFVYQVMAGVYAYHNIGLRVLNNIANIVRDEMNTTLESHEVLLSSLQPKHYWETTKRWNSVDVLMKIPSQTGKEYALGPTHEEEVVPFLQQILTSYKDLPTSVYQIQTKFRDELRAKSGLLRGREFLMKDLYSFHVSVEDLEQFYDRAVTAYQNVFKRCGVEAILTEASGGDFTKYSHEFQVVTEAGEDTIFFCNCGFSQNKEIATVQHGNQCPRCKTGTITEATSAEVGNIFQLKDRFSSAFGMQIQNAKGEKVAVQMGSYGIGISRMMAVIAETHHDDSGLIWPINIAPYHVHLIQIGGEEKITKEAENLYNVLQNEHLEVLYDDRDKRPGEKLSDADLLGIPLRIVISEKTLQQGKIELKHRAQPKESATLLSTDQLLTEVRKVLQ